MSDSTQPADSNLEKAVKEWEKAQVLFIRAAWEGQPAGAHMVEVLKNQHDIENSLISLLSHKSQLVVAYSLLTLKMMDSAALRCLPPDLLQRKEKITTMTGSFSDKMELGAFARHLRKEWLTKHKDAVVPKAPSKDPKRND